MQHISDKIDPLFCGVNAARESSVNYRKRKLAFMRRLLVKKYDEIVRELNKDFSRPEVEVAIAEILTVISLINFLHKNLKKWSRTKKIGKNLMYLGTETRVQNTPKGVVLIIAPWNYPLSMCLYPALTAFAAGNTVCIRPSEHAPHTSLLIESLVTTVFEKLEMAVIHGGVDETAYLLTKPFNHFFFTGSSRVGKIVMEAAAKHLASVTLELGGKSPVIVAPDADLKDAAYKIIWGKCFNAGQTCVAPDYVMVTSDNRDALVGHMIDAYKHYIKEGHRPGLVHTNHGLHLKKMFEDAIHHGGRVLYGGEMDVPERLFGLAILTEMDEKSLVLQEEIFGPILPLITMSDVPQMVKYINNKPSALVLYYFGKKHGPAEVVIDKTLSGAVVVNDMLLSAGHPNAPFGGVGASGMGKYHGHYGLDEFSHQRAIIYRRFGAGANYFYPPYKQQGNVIKKILNYFSSWL